MDSQAKHSMDLSNPSFPVGETVTYRGQAVNKEYGAVLVYTGSMKDYNFLIEGLGLWPEEQLGRGVVVTGMLTEASGEADYMLKNVKIEIDPHPLN